jgi:hypothetical protein
MMWKCDMKSRDLRFDQECLALCNQPKNGGKKNGRNGQEPIFKVLITENVI